MNMNIPASTIGALQRGSQTQNCDFIENGCNDIDKISLISEDNLPK
jgi:hypothetical protein